MKAVLLVDDELGLVETLADFLQDAGYRVETAGSGRDGLAAMASTRPDLVMTDLMMPLMNGKEMITAMRLDPNLATVPVILTSAGRRQMVVPPGETFPEFSLFLRKPFSLELFMEAVRTLIGPGV